MSKGAELIAQERQRQIEGEGFEPTGDYKLADGQLAIAGACYAVADLPAKVLVRKRLPKDGIAFQDAWPLAPDMDKRKKHDRERRLVIAIALLWAELDRVLALKGEGNG